MVSQLTRRGSPEVVAIVVRLDQLNAGQWNAMIGVELCHE